MSPEPSRAVREKATRLLAAGNVRPDYTCPSNVFHVRGDTDDYLVVLTAQTAFCGCHAKHPGNWKRCSHLEACKRVQRRDPDALALLEFARARRTRSAADAFAEAGSTLDRAA